MTIPSAKEQASLFIRTLNDITDATPDVYERYMREVNEYASALLDEMVDKIHDHASDERIAALLREYCQRFDGVAHRVEQAFQTPRPTFPLFRGGLFALFIQRLKGSPNRNKLLTLVERYASSLPYNDKDVAVQTMLTSMRSQVHAENREWDARLISSLEEQVKDIQTLVQLYRSTSKLFEQAASAREPIRAIAHLNLLLSKRVGQLTRIRPLV